MPKKTPKHFYYNPYKSTVYFTILNINQKLYSKYNSSQITYGIKKVDELIYIDSTLFSITFREFLLYEDPTEFLRRFYNKKEQPKKLGKILFFYEKYSRIFPNYTVLSGSKYMYKNIQKKQKMIDNLQELKQQEAENKKHSSAHVTILNNTAVNTILNESNSFCIKTLTQMFGVNIGNNKTKHNNNVHHNISIQDVERLLREINNAEERELHNRALSPKVLMQNSISLKQEIDKIRFNSRENSTTHSKEKNKHDKNNDVDIENIKNYVSSNFQSRANSHYSNNNHSNHNHNNSNRILSPKSNNNFNFRNFKHISQNSILNSNKIILHKKTNSQNINQYISKKTANTSIKNKMLSLEKKTSEFVEHMKHIKKPESAKYSNRGNSHNKTTKSQKKNHNSNNNNNNSQHDYKESTRLTYNLSHIKSDLSSSTKLSPTSSLGKITNIGGSSIIHGIPLDLTGLAKQGQSSSKGNNGQLNLCFVSTPKNSCFTERESAKRLGFVNNNNNKHNNNNNHNGNCSNNINKQKIEGRNIFPTNYFYYSNFSSKSSRTNSQEKTIGFSSPTSKKRSVIATTTTNKMTLNNYLIKRKNKKMLIKENRSIDRNGEMSARNFNKKCIHK